MPHKHEYMIAQYVRDPFRQEGENIGVIVSGEPCVAKFIGESHDGLIDGRSLRFVGESAVYKKWIQYWREQIDEGPDGLIERLTATNGDNYNVIPAGFLTEVADIHEVCADLFRMLVSPRVDRPAEITEDVLVQSDLGSEVLGEFRDRGLLVKPNTTLKNPIFHEAVVAGRIATYTPEFYQNNGRPCVMETVNLATIRKKNAKFHAGYVAKMFDDIRDKNDDAEGIAIVRLNPEEKGDNVVELSMALLKGSANRVVDWQDEEQRKRFLDEREAVAAA